MASRHYMNERDSHMQKITFAIFLMVKKTIPKRFGIKRSLGVGGAKTQCPLLHVNMLL